MKPSAFENRHDYCFVIKVSALRFKAGHNRYIIVSPLTGPAIACSAGEDRDRHENTDMQRRIEPG
jgi:hypothetical protein